LYCCLYIPSLDTLLMTFEVVWPYLPGNFTSTVVHATVVKDYNRLVKALGAESKNTLKISSQAG